MKVYVATIIHYYEGEEVIGVFDTAEKAKHIGESRRQRFDCDGYPYPWGDELHVVEWEVE